jgi:formylmethanofuran dehydrogenase subunit C
MTSPVRLRFRESTPLPVDVSPLVPARLAGRPTAELERLPVRVGNRELPLAELAEVTAGEADTLAIEAAFPSLDRLGRGMMGGRLEVYGDVGAYLGQDMSGGRIELFGSAGAYAAAGMRGGVLHVTADAGPFLGAALPGDRFGMTGGAVVVGGDAGDRVGDRMRRGLIAVAGTLGDFAASRMIGGTVLAVHGCGADPGYAMRRGTLLLGRRPTGLLPTFADNGVNALPWLRLLARELEGLAPGLPSLGERVERWTGCASVGGKGEILIAA